MIMYHMPQASPEWWEARRGIPTASNFHKVISAKAPFDMKPGGSNSYAAELVAETACLNPNYFTERDAISRNRETQYGRDTEPIARQWIAMKLGEPVGQIGFITTDDGFLGCSPDGLTATDGIEIKCPRLDTHAKYRLKPNEVPKDYLPQVHGSLLVTGLKRWHFVSYAPGLEPIHVAVEPNDYTKKLGEVMRQFLEKYHNRLRAEIPDAGTILDWQTWMNPSLPLEQFNQRLPEMSKMPYELKSRIWQRVQNYASIMGLVFNYQTKTYHRPEESDGTMDF